MLERGLAVSGRPAADIERMFGDFITYYSGHIADRSRPFPGVEAALDTLAGRGCAFAVCTNKLEWLSVQLLKSLGLAGRFAAICGQDTSECRSRIPKPCWARCAAPAEALTGP
jgi:phosphoglycolate phosphatase